jgi:hypothetical protein
MKNSKETKSYLTSKKLENMSINDLNNASSSLVKSLEGTIAEIHGNTKKNFTNKPVSSNGSKKISVDPKSFFDIATSKFNKMDQQRKSGSSNKSEREEWSGFNDWKEKNNLTSSSLNTEKKNKKIIKDIDKKTKEIEKMSDIALLEGANKDPDANGVVKIAEFKTKKLKSKKVDKEKINKEILVKDKIRLMTVEEFNKDTEERENSSKIAASNKTPKTISLNIWNVQSMLKYLQVSFIISSVYLAFGTNIAQDREIVVVISGVVMAISISLVKATLSKKIQLGGSANVSTTA